MNLTADRGASEAEAALAAEHVQRLLAEHNLSMSSIEASGALSGDDGKRVREQGVGSRQIYKWQRTLMAAVAELNYCKAFERLQRCSGKTVFDGYDLIGRVSNVATVKVMFEYLLQSIERLARDDIQDPKQFFTRYAHSFKEGCSDRLIERLKAKQEQILAEQERAAKEETVRRQHPGATSSNLPAVVLRDVVQTEHDLNNDLINGWAPGTTAKNRREQAEYEDRQRELRLRRYAEAIARGLNEAEARYASYGYNDDQARELARPEPEKPSRPETETQRRKRHEREQRDNDRFWHRQHKYARRLDQTAYIKGHAKGDDVGLDRQVDKNERGKLT